MLLGLFLIVFFLILPAFDSIGAVKEGIVQQKERIAQAQKFNETMKELDEKYKGNIEEMERFINILPGEKELPKLLIQLETLATANGLLMKSVGFAEVQPKTNIQPPASDLEEELLPQKTNEESETPIVAEAVPKEQYRILGVNLELSGRYDSFKNYLLAIEGNARLMDVDSLNFFMTQSLQGEDSSFSVNLNVYYQ